MLHGRSKHLEHAWDLSFKGHSQLCYLHIQVLQESLMLGEGLVKHVLDTVRQAAKTHRGLRRGQIELARDIYLLEMGGHTDRSAIQAKISSLRTLTDEISEDTPGMHCLVWSYFIAAVSSDTEADRHHFKHRLGQVHNKTRMNNISAAIDTLDHVWAQSPPGGWISRFHQVRPVLAM